MNIAWGFCPRPDHLKVARLAAAARHRREQQTSRRRTGYRAQRRPRAAFLDATPARAAALRGAAALPTFPALFSRAPNQRAAQSSFACHAAARARAGRRGERLRPFFAALCAANWTPPPSIVSPYAVAATQIFCTMMKLLALLATATALKQPLQKPLAVRGGGIDKAGVVKAVNIAWGLYAAQMLLALEDPERPL